MTQHRHRPRFSRVAFDVDSTLSRIEGIDELARLRGVDVAEMTERAMRGEIRLEEVYGRRLERVRPDARMLARVADLYVARRTPGATALVKVLEREGVDVYVVSGALRPTILPLAQTLGIPGHRVFAVDVTLDRRGRYAGFDELSPLARADGKRFLLRGIADGHRTAMVGDGSTDLAAAPSVDAFIAFTGVARRPDVADRAAYAVRSFRELRHILLPGHA